MSDDYFDKDIGIDDKIVIYDETEAKESYYNTKRKTHLSGDASDEDEEPTDSESVRKGSLATTIAFVSLMVFVVLFFVLNDDWQFIGAVFPSIGVLVQIITFVRM